MSSLCVSFARAMRRSTPNSTPCASKPSAMPSAAASNAPPAYQAHGWNSARRWSIVSLMRAAY
jgi:hypothetical protein